MQYCSHPQGTDVTKSTLATLAVQGLDKVHSNTNSLVTMMSAIPNQGMLAPYQKIPVYFRFSPRYNTAQLGWKGTTAPPPRQDFALFMQFAVIGSSKGFVNGEATINGHDNIAGKIWIESPLQNIEISQRKDKTKPNQLWKVVAMKKYCTFLLFSSDLSAYHYNSN